MAVFQNSGVFVQGPVGGGGGGEGLKPFTSLTDPAQNAITQATVDTYGGVVITLTTTGNSQTLPAPSDLSVTNDKSERSFKVLTASL